jgi:hypothetical protein
MRVLLGCAKKISLMANAMDRAVHFLWLRYNRLEALQAKLSHFAWGVMMATLPRLTLEFPSKERCLTVLKLTLSCFRWTKLTSSGPYPFKESDLVKILKLTHTFLNLSILTAFSIRAPLVFWSQKEFTKMFWKKFWSLSATLNTTRSKV